MIQHPRIRALLLVALPLLLLAGCKSFEEQVQPLITPQPPEGYVPPVYMTGTTTVEAVDQNDLTAEVWRVNSAPYPDSVQLFVRVYDSKGKLVTGLAPPYYTGGGDYRSIWRGLSERIGDDGRPIGIDQYTVREFSDKDGIPYELSLVLDYSGTMGTNIKGLEDAARAFIGLKRPQDRISVVKFDRTPKVAVAQTSDQGALLGAFGGGLAGYGTYTALYAAARTGAEQVASAPADHPRAIVLFTDGEDNASTVTPAQLYEFSRANSIPIFTVAFGAVNRDVLGEISSYTGGRFYQAYTAEELRAVFEDIYRSLRNYYVVTYRPPFQIGKHIATLRLNLPKASKGLEATAIYNTITGATLGEGNVLAITDTLFFEYNKSEVREEAIPSIRALAGFMRERERMKIEIRGHTDAVGTEEYNQRLSEARAQAVRQALIDLGIEENRLRARGFGWSQPVASNQTEEGRAKNRRVEFVIIQR